MTSRARALLAVLITLGLLVPALSSSADPVRSCDQARAGQGPHHCEATLLYFNDAHDIRPVTSDGETRGGVARLATVIDQVRDEEGHTAVAFGGDLGGGSLFGGIYHGFPLVEAFNTIGIDLANFGQHDFDFGVANARDLVAASDFPWVSTNLVDAEGEPFTGRPWMVEPIGAYRVGYLGLTDAMDTTSADAGVDQAPVIDSARRAVAEMQSQTRPDVIVAVTQQGLEENKALLEAVPQVDVVLTEELAEASSVFHQVPDGRWILAPEGNLGSVLRVDLSRADRRLVISPSALEVDDSVAPDPELRAVEEHYERRPGGAPRRGDRQGHNASAAHGQCPPPG